MSNFGGAEMLVVFLLALMVLGPERLPKVARQAGQVMRQVRQMSSGFQEELRSAIEDPKPSDFHGSSVSASTPKAAVEPADEAAEEAAEPDPAEIAADATPPTPSPTPPIGDRRLSAVPEPEIAEDDGGQPNAGGSRATG